MRRVFPLLLLLALGCQPSGCTRPPAPDGPTVTDDIGRSVVVYKSPKRIVSLSPAATEILFDIGLGPNVVAGTEFDTYPDEAKQLPRIGGFTPQSINVEAILAHKPDLVVAAPQKDVVAALEKFGIPVVVLDPKGVGDTWNNIELLGIVTGCEAKAKEVAEQGRKRFTKPTYTTQAVRPSTLRVLFVLADEPLITCGQGTFIDEIISTAGGKNVFADVKESWPKVSDEQVLARGADVILCVEHTGGAGSVVPGRLKLRPGWDKLKAVQTGRVYAVDADLLTRPGPRLVDGLEVVEKLFEPVGAPTVTDYVLKAFETLRPDLDGIFTSAHAKPLADWRRTQQAFVTASGAGTSAVPGLHLVGIAADVVFLMNRMSVCSYGIGAILGHEANLGNVLEPEDFAVVLAVWANEGGIAEAIGSKEPAGTSAVTGGKVLGKSVYRILAKTVCEKAGLLTDGKLSGALAGKVAARFAGKLGGKAATGFIPLVGAVVGGGVNLWFLTGIASAAEQWFRFKVKG